MRRKGILIYSIMALCVTAISGCGGRADRQTGMDFSEGVQGEETAGGPPRNSTASTASGDGGTQGGTAVKTGTDGRSSGSPGTEGRGSGSADVTGKDGGGDREKEPGIPDALKVTGTQLTDSRGEPVQLRGISTHGLAWYPQYVNEECFRQFREEWGMDVVRLAMYTAEYGGYCTGGNQEELTELIREGVSCATDCGMYVIIDWHILSDGNPNTYLEEAKTFFGDMAEEYSEYSNIIYEICNEPNGGVSWSDIKEYAEQIIEVIREKDEDALILVGTPNWCQYVEQAAADPITDYDNIMYTLHFYAATHTDSLRDAMTKAVEAGLPVFVSEYGICDASGNGAIDREQADRWADLLDEYGISYVAWNLSNKSETSAILKSSCGKVSGFALEDLSDSGKWLYERLGAGGSGTAGEKSGGNASVSHSGGTAGDAGDAGGNGSNGSNTDGARSLSGSGESAPDSLNVAARLVNSWGQDGGTCFQYELTVSNAGDGEQNGWTVRLHFSRDITLQDSWNGVYTAEGKELTISSMDYNGFIPADDSVENIGFIIKTDGECLLEQ